MNALKNIDTFISRWQGAGANERCNYHCHPGR
jgi:hypothetical protein